MNMKARNGQAPDEDDEDIRVAIERGDEDLAMELLFTRYGERIFQHCRRMLGNSSDADDVSQTVFVQAFEHLCALLDRELSIEARLRKIATNRCLDRFSALERTDRVVDQLKFMAPPWACPVEPIGMADPRVRRALDDCLDGLEPRGRIALLLRFDDELSYSEISARLCDTPGALRVRVSRTVQVLLECLEGKRIIL